MCFLLHVVLAAACWWSGLVRYFALALEIHAAFVGRPNSWDCENVFLATLCHHPNGLEGETKCGIAQALPVS